MVSGSRHFRVPFNLGTRCASAAPMASRNADELLQPADRSVPLQARVLVTEDNAAMRHLMADVLQNEGYFVAEAADAFEMQSAILDFSLERPHQEPFDLIVSDIFMPGKSGLAALTEMRRSGLSSRFLVVTTFPDADTYHRIEELDVRLLVKPFSLREFRNVTTELLHSPVPKLERTL